MVRHTHKPQAPQRRDTLRESNEQNPAEPGGAAFAVCHYGCARRCAAPIGAFWLTGIVGLVYGGLGGPLNNGSVAWWVVGIGVLLWGWPRSGPCSRCRGSMTTGAASAAATACARRWPARAAGSTKAIPWKRWNVQGVRSKASGLRHFTPIAYPLTPQSGPPFLRGILAFLLHRQHHRAVHAHDQGQCSGDVDG